MDKESFIKAFDNHVGSSHAVCYCGREFYNYCDDDSLEEGEIERLDKDLKATGFDYSVGYVEFEGTIYVSDCDCWIERAGTLMRFIDAHAVEIANYLTLEKKRKQAEADAMPVVEG